VHASVGEVEILKVGKITELRRHHNIPAEIEMLQVSQREQRSWYLAFKKCKCSTRTLEYWVIVRIAPIAGGSRGSEIEPDHMAGDVAAPDTSPAAAVMVLFPPRRQPACGIVCDGSLERQQHGHLHGRRGRSCSRRRRRQAAAIYSLLTNDASWRVVRAVSTPYLAISATSQPVVYEHASMPWPFLFCLESASPLIIMLYR
jgi:hypothetical protein